MNTYHYIYQITNKANGYIYIGVRQSNVPPEDDTNYMGSGTRIKYAISKYGKQQFEKTIISLHETRESALAAESTMVNFDFVQRLDTYNLKVGGEGGSVKGRFVSEETRQKLSAIKKGKPMPPFSEEHRRKLSIANKGTPKPARSKTMSDEHKQKISVAKKGRHLSEETKRKISESRRANVNGFGTCQSQ